MPEPLFRACNVDIPSLVSRADLCFNGPVERPEAGLPLGNGCMGSLLWIEDATLRLQINRVDVFSSNSYTSSFRYLGDGTFKNTTDFCGSCGGVSILVENETFAVPDIRQHLSLYNGIATIATGKVQIQAVAWQQGNVLALEINTERAASVNLKMLFPPFRKIKEHTTTSTLSEGKGSMCLTQVFEEPADTGIREGDHYCMSAVTVSVIGRSGQARLVNEHTMRLDVPEGSGPFTVLIASAASMDRAVDVKTEAMACTATAEALGFEGIVAENQHWWSEYWGKSYIQLHSADGTADFLEQQYNYFLYVMACCSRGKYPPKFNGLLFITDADTRMWGSQYWWWNEQTMYRALPAANHLELMQPVFNLYSNMFEAQKRVARQQWGCEGIWLAETLPFNGMEQLPEQFVENLQDFMYERKKFEETSPAFQEFIKNRHPFQSRWNFLEGTGEKVRKTAPYGYVVHLFSSGAKIAYLYWQYYEYTLDKIWFRERAYPMLKGIAEFYRTFPNFRKDNNGIYHIHNVNSHECVWGGHDTDEEIAAIRGIMALVLRASEILNVDTDLRPKWCDILENIAPYVTTDNPEAIGPVDRQEMPTIWAVGRKPSQRDKHPGECSQYFGPTLRPCIHYDLLTLETDDPKMREIADTTFDYTMSCHASPKEGCQWIPTSSPFWLLNENSIAAAHLGKADQIKFFLPMHAKSFPAGILTNRMTLAEGPQTQGVEHLGMTSFALQLALVQSIPPGPGCKPVIHLFPAWPVEWNAQFRLLCREGFMVTSAIEDGTINFVAIESQFGAECRLRNPWGECPVMVIRSGKKSEMISGNLLVIPTEQSEYILLQPDSRMEKTSRGQSLHNV